MPRLRVFAGPNGSGKSTLLADMRPEWVGIYVNADDLERDIKTSGCFDLAAYQLAENPEQSLERLRAAMTATERRIGDRAAHLAGQLALDGTRILVTPADIDSYLAATIADFLRHELIQAGKDFTFETVMSHPGKVAFMAEAQQLGYRTYLYFIGTDDVAINIDRVHQRVDLGGHAVDEGKIRKRYEKSIALLRSACNVSNRAYIFDNSGDEHVLVAELTNGEELVLHTALMPQWLIQTDLWQDFRD